VFDPSSLSPDALAYLDSQIKAADLKARTGSKANAAAEARRETLLQIAKTLGLATDEPPDPAVLTQHLEQARDTAWTYAVELQVYRTAAAAGASPDALLDSMAFIRSLDDLGELDPNSDEFKTQIAAKVQEAAAKYPATAGQAPAGPRPDPSQGSRGTPPAARPTSVNQAVGAHYASKRTGR
jgi:hypothetical protein